MTHRNRLFAASILSVSVGLLACEEKPEQKTAAVEKAEEAAAPAGPKEKSAEEKAAEEAAKAAEAKKNEEDAKAQAAVDENPLTECCRALGKKGYMERNPDFMAASKSCGEALDAKDDLAKVLPAIKKALKGSSLPSECGE